MLVEVKVPTLSESVAEATLVSWHKKEGEHVDRDENLIDIETDKVVLELPAPSAGVLTKIIKGDGEIVAGGEIIATIDTEAAPVEAKAASAISAIEAAPTVTAAPRSDAEPVSAPTSSTSATPAMMPAARNLAAQANLTPEEINAIKGSGRDGRVTKEDVAVQVEKQVSRPVPSSGSASPATAPALTADSPVSAGNRPEQRVPMSRLRARIAERLVQSQSTGAILTTFNEVNMRAIMDLRARYKDKFEKEHGVNSASCRSL